MKSLLPRLSPKFRLFFPIFTGILISVTLMTVYSVSKVKKSIYQSVENTLVLEVQTLNRMFQRERDLKLAKVKTDLRVARKLFYDRKLVQTGRTITMQATSQITGISHETTLPEWTYDGKPLPGSIDFVDEVKQLVGGTSTIFQRIDSGFIRISTNVLKSDGSRAIGTYIPNDSPVAETILRNETYFGRAYVVNAWYVTAYEPILIDGRVEGILYVGDKEKDLDELRDKIASLRIGNHGYPFVLDEEGLFLIHPFAEGEVWKDEPILDTILRKAHGVRSFAWNREAGKHVIAWEYFPEFRLTLAACVPLHDLTGAPVREVIVNSAGIALIILLALSFFIYFITTENVGEFLTQLELSGKKLESARQALEQSERHFQTLFNNTSDEIFVIDTQGRFLEVNEVACQSLGYSRDEFLGMNIADLKTDRYKPEVAANISRILKFGQYRYESENLAKDGRVIPVEMKSRMIDYRGRQVILTIARDISERKEMEDRILTTIIQTEENERKRFAADLHDDLAPILSTVKLYTDLLKKKNFRKLGEEEAVRNIEELLDMAITSTRNISRNIRPNILQDFGLAAAVNDFCSFIRKSESVNIEVVSHQYRVEQRGIEESVLYQAVKELINNTLRHASAGNIRIELKSFDNQVILYYRDDGAGFDLNEALRQNTGLGLNNIINKIKSVKGTVDINTRPGEGMFLIASVKLKSR